MLTMWVMSKLRRELGAINNNGFSRPPSPAPGHLYVTITKGSSPCTSVFCFHFHQGIFACPFVLSYVVCAMIWMSGVLWYLLLEGRRVADIYIYFSKMVMSNWMMYNNTIYNLVLLSKNSWTVTVSCWISFSCNNLLSAAQVTFCSYFPSSYLFSNRKVLKENNCSWTLNAKIKSAQVVKAPVSNDGKLQNRVKFLKLQCIVAWLGCVGRKANTWWRWWLECSMDN